MTRACLLKHQHSQQRQWESRAAAACERAVALEPEAPEVLVALGSLRLASGQHDAAIAAYERVLAQRPGAIEARLGIARAHLEAGRPDAAEATALGAISGSPRDWRTHSLLGMIYFRSGRYAQAVEPFRKVVELTPDSARGIRNLGSALFRLDRFDEAALAYEESIALLPNDEAYSNLGTAYYFMGRCAEAIVAFRKATELTPSDPIRWGNLGNACHWIPGHEKEAEVALGRAIALMRERLDRNPSHSDWWARMAGWLANRGSRAEALEAITRATALAPGDVRVMGMAGRVYFQLGERAESLRWFRSALDAGHPPGEFVRSRELAPLRDDPEFVRLLGVHPAGAGPARSA
jgi:tetratricopeptide (TPR) repeat protein